LKSEFAGNWKRNYPIETKSQKFTKKAKKCTNPRTAGK